MSVNAVLAFIEAAEPKNEMEVALAIQMACTHAVAMAVLSRAGEGSVIVLPSHDLVETRSPVSETDETLEPTAQRRHPALARIKLWVIHSWGTGGVVEGYWRGAVGNSSSVMHRYVSPFQ